MLKNSCRHNKKQNSPIVSPELGLRVLKSWSMLITMGYLTAHEQHHTQQISVWFYNYGTSRVQTKISFRWSN